MPSTPSTINPLSGGSLTITDPQRKAYQQAWIGMADDIDGKSKWLRIGGIAEDGTSRLALAAAHTSILGSLGVNCVPSVSLEVAGEAYVTGRLSVDQQLTAGTITTEGAISAGTVVRAGNLALSSSPPGDKTKEPGAWTSLSSNAHHGDGSWHFPDTTQPAVTLELDSRAGAGRFVVCTTTKTKPQEWQQRLAIDGETGNVMLSGGLLNASGGPYVSAVEVVDQHGGLPISKTFTTAGRHVILLVSGTGRRPGSGLVGMVVQVDGVSRREVKRWTNEDNSHQLFAPAHVVLTDLAAGDHTINLAALAETITDENDHFNVTIIEF